MQSTTVAALAHVLLLAGCASTQPAQPAQRPPQRDPSEPRVQLDKGDIVAGMNRIKPSVGACYDRFHQPGVFSVAMTVVGSGKVAHANVSGPDGKTADCIAFAAGSATFPPFTGEALSFVYPFVFR
jgi:hypothetical protein